MKSCLGLKAICGFMIAVVILFGCVIQQPTNIADIYYFEGPERSLEVLATIEPASDNRVLVHMEKAMSLLELGRYKESLMTLEPLVDELEIFSASQDGKHLSNNDNTFCGESFERVMVPSLGVVAALALQQDSLAADWAKRVLHMIDTVDCADCDFDGARYLAALALAGDEKGLLATSLLFPVVAKYPDISFFKKEFFRFARINQSKPDAEEREIVAIFLLGEGPFKQSSWYRHGFVDKEGWPRYLKPADSGATSGILTLDDGKELISTTIMDLWSSAGICLKARLDHELAEVVQPYEESLSGVRYLAKAIDSDLSTAARLLAVLDAPPDLRGWQSLPATIQVVRVPVAITEMTCQLLAVNTEDQIVWDEIFDVPQEWTGRPLFVVRRVP